MINATSDLDKVRLMSVKQPHAGDWLLASPITSVGLRMSDEEVRISAGVRLGALLCQPHICVCGTKVNARGIHGQSCRKNASIQIRHNSINDIVWRTMRRAGITLIKEQLGYYEMTVSALTELRRFLGAGVDVWNGTSQSRTPSQPLTYL